MKAPRSLYRVYVKSADGLWGATYHVVVAQYAVEDALDLVTAQAAKDCDMDEYYITMVCHVDAEVLA